MVCPSAVAFFQPQPNPLARLQRRLGFAAQRHDAVSAASSQFCASGSSYGQHDTSPPTPLLSLGGCGLASKPCRESHMLLRRVPTAPVVQPTVPHSTCFVRQEPDGF